MLVNKDTLRDETPDFKSVTILRFTLYLVR